MRSILGLDSNQNEEQREPVVLSLTLSGLWKMMAGFGTLLAGAFTLGMYYQADAAKLQVEAKNIEVAQSKAEVDRLQKTCPVERAKEDFKALESRVLRKKREVESFPANKRLQKELKDSAKPLAEFLEENVNKKPDENGTPIIRVMLSEKDRNVSGIQFRGEQDIHEVPQEAKKLTRGIIWNNPPRENAPSIFEAVLTQRRPSLPTPQTGIEIRKFYPVMVHPQP